MFCFGAVLGVIGVVSGVFAEMEKNILLIYVDGMVIRNKC